jgi:predicted small secreted protein
MLMRTLCVLLTVLTLSACQTVAGAGRDIQSAGHAIQKAAD